MTKNILLDSYIRRVEEQHLEADSVMVFRGSELVAEHRWVPDVPHMIYSHTKSFAATAIGIAVDDGLLRLEDRVSDAFADEMPAAAYPWAEELTLRHLLTMSSGREVELLMKDTRGTLETRDWVRFVLSHPIRLQPGTRFKYSNGDTYLAGVMLEKAVGMSLADFCMERLMRPMGIPLPEWEHCPQGHTFAASGLWLRTADMGKLGILYLQGGEWDGRRLVSADWVREASTCHIDTLNHGKEWSCGYGYQFWMNPIPGSYRADGYLGQFSHVLPEQGAVIAMNNHAQDPDPILDAMREEIVSRL